MIRSGSACRCTATGSAIRELLDAQVDSDRARGRRNGRTDGACDARRPPPITSGYGSTVRLVLGVAVADGARCSPVHDMWPVRTPSPRSLSSGGD